MLSPSLRLTKKEAIQRCLAKGTAWSCPVFKVVWHRYPMDAASAPTAAKRFAFVVSKKVNKRAVVRNRLRRRVREALRLELQQQRREGANTLLHSFDAVVFPREKGLMEPLPVIQEAWSQYLANMEQTMTSSYTATIEPGNPE